MPELTIPDIDPATLELLRQRADRHAQTVETEAKVILAEVLRAPASGDPWAAGREFPDSTPLLRGDRDR